MRNRDLAAAPIDPDRRADHENLFQGLTKLEAAAIAAMQSIRNAHWNIPEQQMAELAVRDANALFDELDGDKT